MPTFVITVSKAMIRCATEAGIQAKSDLPIKSLLMTILWNVEIVLIMTLSP